MFKLLADCLNDIFTGNVFKPIDRIVGFMFSHPIKFLKFVLLIVALSLIGNFIGGSDKKKDAPKTVQAQAQEQVYAYINADALNMRSSPSAQAEVVTRLNRNDRVQLLETPDASKTWVRIRSGSNEGYVNANFLKQQ